jgi:hypothetical protein
MGIMAERRLGGRPAAAAMRVATTGGEDGEGDEVGCTTPI